MNYKKIIKIDILNLSNMEVSGLSAVIYFNYIFIRRHI